MNYRLMGKISSYILLIEAAMMIPALLISLGYGEGHAAVSFVITILVTAGVGLILYLISRGGQQIFRAREGLVCVGISWILLSLFGCLPFVISGEIPHFMDALFESVSGFTTTGASILTDVEAMTHGMLYWRSFTHWVGGMGILVFLLAIIPLAGGKSGFTLHLLRAESPGPNVGKIVPKMRQTAMILYILYIGLTVLCFIFLVIGRMPIFDAVCTAVGTAGTGGFGIRGDSMASYSPYLQGVVTTFMLLFGVNFTCYYLLIRREFKSLLQDEELRWYLLIIIGSTALMVINAREHFASLGEAVHHVLFTVAALITTSGFATVDFDLWPMFSKGIILGLMCLGAMAGSTGGGFKLSRLMLMIRGVRRSVHQIIHPNRIQNVRLSSRSIPENVISGVYVYTCAYVLLIGLSFLILGLDREFSLASNFSAVISCFNNIGPGLDQVGPTRNYFAYSDLSKFVLILDMLLGRLEIYPILVLFSRSTWKKL